jgi:TRAP-type mannitol/chloroaromatic compound transport system permease small subunit
MTDAERQRGRPASHALQRALERLAEAMAITGGAVVFMLVLLMTADALARKIARPVPGAYEFSEAAMVAAVFLPLMYVQLHREHVFVSVATLRLPPWVQAALDAVAAFVGLATFGLVTWLAAAKAWDAWLIGEYRVAVITVPIWPFRWFIPLGTGLLCLQLALTVVEMVRSAARLRSASRQRSGSVPRAVPGRVQRDTEAVHLNDGSV